MAFAIEDYIDEEFETYQALIGKLSASTPLVDFSEIQVLPSPFFVFLYSSIPG